MKKILQIHIDKPCGENWKDFPKTVSGFTVTGHCASCSKNVIDFTSWSDERIREYFEQRPTNICGRLKNTQLKEYVLPKKPRRTFQGLLSLLLTTFIIFSSKLTEAQSAKKANYSTEVHTKRSQTRSAANTPKAKEEFIVRGKVIDAGDKAELPSVNVVQKGTLNGTVTQIDGTFELLLENPKDNEVLIISFIGFNSIEVPIDRNAHNSDLTLQMELSVSVLGGIAVGGVGYRTISPRRWWWKFKGLFRRSSASNYESFSRSP